MCVFAFIFERNRVHKINHAFLSFRFARDTQSYTCIFIYNLKPFIKTIFLNILSAWFNNFNVRVAILFLLIFHIWRVLCVVRLILNTFIFLFISLRLSYREWFVLPCFLNSCNVPTLRMRYACSTIRFSGSGFSSGCAGNSLLPGTSIPTWLIIIAITATGRAEWFISVVRIVISEHAVASATMTLRALSSLQNNNKVINVPFGQR